MGSPKSMSLLKGNVQWPDPQDDPALTPDQRTELRAPNFLFRVDGTLYQNVIGLYVAIKELDGKISTIKGLTGQGRKWVASAHDMYASAVDTMTDVVFNLKWDGMTYDPVKEIRLRQAAAELFNSARFMSALWRSIQDGGQEEDSWPTTVGNAIEDLRRDNRIDRTWHVTPAQESELEPSRSPREQLESMVERTTHVEAHNVPNPTKTFADGTRLHRHGQTGDGSTEIRYALDFLGRGSQSIAHDSAIFGLGNSPPPADRFALDFLGRGPQSLARTVIAAKDHADHSDEFASSTGGLLSKLGRQRGGPSIDMSSFAERTRVDMSGMAEKLHVWEVPAPAGWAVAPARSR